jgi:hypothetical protein
VDLAPTQKGHELVADPLELKAFLDPLGVIAGHLDCALVAQKVGRVEQKDVKDMALDPLAAVEQTP